jgi:hypothetical protein
MSAIPSQEILMSRLEDALGKLPSSEAVMQQVEKKLDSLLPPRNEATISFQSILKDRINTVLPEPEIKKAFSQLLPTTDQMLKSVVTALPQKERLQETLTLGITEAIHNALPERLWLESVSRGLFDEHAKGLLPKRDEVVSIIREEIRSKLLTIVERVIQEQIMKITSELS